MTNRFRGISRAASTRPSASIPPTARLPGTALQSVLVLTALAALPSVSDGALEWIERPDDMQVVLFEDYDRHGDRVRLLYQTMPSLEQRVADPEGWTNNVYVVEIDAASNIEQRRLKSDQANYAALALRRGHDELIALLRSAKTGEAERLERWSLADGSVVSSVPPPSVLQAGTSGRIPLVPTDDGNLFVTAGGGTASSAPNAEARPLEWYKLAADGHLERGQYTRGAANLAVDGAFGARDGRVGLFLRISVHRGADGIETDFPTPIRRPVGARTLEATVGNEVRLLVAGSGAADRLSPALERSLIWGGELQPPKDLPFQQVMEQSMAQQRVMEDTELEFGARRTLLRSENRLWSWPLVKRSSNGYAVLATVTAARDRNPPAAGPYLLEVGTDGALRRELYLGPVAEAIGADFTDFLPTEDDTVLLAGTRRLDDRVVGQVTRVDARGQGEWTADLDAPAGPFDGIARNRSGVWVFSRGLHQERRKLLLWVERVEESRQTRVPAPPVQSRADAPPARTPPPAPAQAAAPAPTIEPVPANGCSCTCEEFAEVQSLAERLGRTPAPGQPPVLPDQATMSKLMCGSSCGLRYSTCPAR
jgi:hypothetical protein